MKMYARYSNKTLYITGKPFNIHGNFLFNAMMCSDFVIKLHKDTKYCEILKCRSGILRFNKLYSLKEVMDHIKEFYEK